jgi:hypothetical protein
MYSERSMNPLAMLRDAFRSDGWGTAALLAMLLCGCLALVSAEWVSALLFFSVGAVSLGAAAQVKRSAGAEELPKRVTGVFLAGGTGLLAVACASAVSGDVRLVVLAGLGGVISVIGAVMDWRRTSTGHLFGDATDVRDRSLR